jgi:hypothetical protein
MREEEGKPALGSASTAFGVRLPNSAHKEIEPDIRPDVNGLVYPRSGGMSVSPSAGELPAHRIPRRLKSRYPQATGNDKVRIWRMGDGPFSDARLTDVLILRIDSKNPRHGLIEPAIVVLADAFVVALEETKNSWSIDEGAGI